MKFITTLIKAALVAYLIIFAVVNNEPTSIKLFFNSMPLTMPMFLFTLLCVFAGFLLGALFMLSDYFAHSREIKKLKKNIAEYDKEISRLKNLTLTDNKPAEIANTDTTPNNNL